ncbi:hypothetical protein AGMMS49574_10520 [Bacteroidia bacterium]|nr:hypothetical protein AGMMS49574_10520 [Bacteroidia bacterium]
MALKFRTVQTARKYKIENTPDAAACNAIEELVVRLLQPLRVVYGKQIRITSGFRSYAVNKLVGGAPRSLHLKGEAADCKVRDASKLLDVLLESGLPFDQAILYKKRNFLHLSLRCGSHIKNRQQVIINEE